MATVIYPGGHFTHCVHHGDYEVLPDTAPAIATMGPASFGKVTCDFLLGGKLVCMSEGRVCAIGTIVGLEDTDYGKSGYNAIDNDFSFNILLAPFTTRDFWPQARSKKDPYSMRDWVAATASQGNLIADVAGTVAGLKPREPRTGSPVDGYGVMWRYPGANTPSPIQVGETRAADPDQLRQNNLNKLSTAVEGDDVLIALPVLHCECEGSRIWAVCNALAPFLDILSGKPPGSPGPSATDICHDVLGWIPFVGDVLCAIAEAIVDLAMLPIVLAAAAAAAVAWLAAQKYDDLFLTGPIKEKIKMGQVVVVQGRWCWDGGHAGHMELHPVTAIAIADGVPNDPADPAASARLSDLQERWCQLLDSAPPPQAPPSLMGPPPVPGADLTPHQKATALAQQQPENQWTVHPVIDGCQPRQNLR